MVIWWLCWHRTILIRNNTQKPYSQFPPVHDFGKPWWGVAYVPCMTNLRALCAWVIRWHVTCMLSLAEHWQGRRALSNHVCAHSVISMWHVVCLQHLARACSEQSRSTTVLPINHVIQMHIGICESWLLGPSTIARNTALARGRRAKQPEVGTELPWRLAAHCWLHCIFGHSQHF